MVDIRIVYEEQFVDLLYQFHKKIKKNIFYVTLQQPTTYCRTDNFASHMITKLDNES